MQYPDGPPTKQEIINDGLEIPSWVNQGNQISHQNEASNDLLSMDKNLMKMFGGTTLSASGMLVHFHDMQDGKLDFMPNTTLLAAGAGALYGLFYGAVAIGLKLHDINETRQQG